MVHLISFVVSTWAAFDPWDIFSDGYQIFCAFMAGSAFTYCVFKEQIDKGKKQTDKPFNQV